MDEQKPQSYSGEEYRYMNDRNKVTPPRSRKLLFGLSVALAVVVIIAAVLGVITFRLATSPAHSTMIPIATPTSSQSLQATSQASATPTIQPTPTPTETTLPSPGVTPTITGQSASGAYPFNQELACSNCVDPILVTISQVTINTASQNMTWKLKLLNRTGAQVDFIFTMFALADPSNTSYPGSGDWINNDLSYITQPEKPISGTVVFPFMPNKGEIYTLSVQMRFSISGYTDIQFDPTQFTF